MRCQPEILASFWSDWYHESMSMTLRLTPEQDAALTRLARAWGTSKQQAAVRAIEDSDQKQRRVKFADIPTFKSDVSVQKMIADERGRLEDVLS
ncbi:hypothetical protein HHJ81_06145 [Mobiluncus mulieris]|nr:hypothetical protein [Mobiluncus mulieris]